jgi:signal peptidase II
VKKNFKYLSIFFILLFIDIITKFWVHFYVNKMSWMHPFYPFGGIGVFENFLGISFSLNNVENTGAGWGIFSSYPLALFIFRVVVVIGLIIFLLFYNKDKKKNTPLLLIITGAIGNIIDFILYRKVIDMFHFNFWGYSYGIFNIADSMITIGIIYLFIILLKKND